MRFQVRKIKEDDMPEKMMVVQPRPKKPSYEELETALALCAHCYITPLAGCRDSLRTCLEWLKKLPHGWRLGVQAHRQWGIP